MASVSIELSPYAFMLLILVYTKLEENIQVD